MGQFVKCERVYRRELTQLSEQRNITKRQSIDDHDVD